MLRPAGKGILAIMAEANLRLADFELDVTRIVGGTLPITLNAAG